MDDCKNPDILVVTTTVGSMEEAQAFARELVQRRLAACVQLEPIAASHFRWDGKLCEEPEVRVSIKTVPRLRASLERAFEELHPYDVPQFIASAHDASEAYGNWVRAETSAA